MYIRYVREYRRIMYSSSPGALRSKNGVEGPRRSPLLLALRARPMRSPHALAHLSFLNFSKTSLTSISSHLFPPFSLNHLLLKCFFLNPIPPVELGTTRCIAVRLSHVMGSHTAPALQTCSPSNGLSVLPLLVMVGGVVAVTMRRRAREGGRRRFALVFGPREVEMNGVGVSERERECREETSRAAQSSSSSSSTIVSDVANTISSSISSRGRGSGSGSLSEEEDSSPSLAVTRMPDRLWWRVGYGDVSNSRTMDSPSLRRSLLSLRLKTSSAVGCWYPGLASVSREARASVEGLTSSKRHAGEK